MLGDLSFAEASAVIKPLFFFVLGMVVYALFVFHFYRFLARKDIFKLDLEKYNTAKSPGMSKFVQLLLYTIKYVLLFPIFAFFWFGILTVMLTFLSRDAVIDNILLVSVAVVSMVRMTSYYSEDLSKDLAKILPFTLLGIFLIDISYFSLSTSYNALLEIPSRFNFLVYYLIFAIMLEFTLRIIHGLFYKYLAKEETN